MALNETAIERPNYQYKDPGCQRDWSRDTRQCLVGGKVNHRIYSTTVHPRQRSHKIGNWKCRREHWKLPLSIWVHVLGRIRGTEYRICMSRMWYMQCMSLFSGTIEPSILTAPIGPSGAEATWHSACVADDYDFLVSILFCFPFFHPCILLILTKPLSSSCWSTPLAYNTFVNPSLQLIWPNTKPVFHSTRLGPLLFCVRQSRFPPSTLGEDPSHPQQ